MTHTCLCQVFLGGSIVSDGPVKVLEDPEEQPRPRIIQVRRSSDAGVLPDYLTPCPLCPSLSPLPPSLLPPGEACSRRSSDVTVEPRWPQTLRDNVSVQRMGQTVLP